MKFLIVALTFISSLLSTKTFAEDTAVSATVLQSFRSSFEYATEVKWSLAENMYKAEFEFNGQYISAFYDADGAMVAMTRNVSTMQMPITLQASLKKDYQNYWISDLFELTDNGGTTYYITLENPDAKVVLKSNGSYSWSTFQKQKK